MHNSFDTIENETGWVAKSHNFPVIEGVGSTEKEALEDMNRKIVYFKDNYNKEYMDSIRARIKAGFECMCGYKLRPDDQILGVVN